MVPSFVGGLTYLHEREALWQWSHTILSLNPKQGEKAEQTDRTVERILLNIRDLAQFS